MPTVSFLLKRFEKATEHEIIAHSRLRSANKHLHEHLGPLQAPDELTNEVIAEYCVKRRAEGKAERNKETASSTLRRELGQLQTVLERALADKKIPYVPKIIKPKRRKPNPRALSPPQLWQLLQVVEEGTPLFLFIMIALYTSARLSAICELTRNRVNFYLNQIDFRTDSELQDRMKQRAIVPMCKTLRQILLAAKAVAREECVVGVSPRTIQREFAEAVRLAGLPKAVTPHWLRHTAITMIVTGLSKEVHRGDISYFLASRIAGHNNVATTEENYIHLAVGELIPGIAALERQINYVGFKKNKGRINCSRTPKAWKMAA